jgi:hypothetical protein
MLVQKVEKVLASSPIGHAALSHRRKKQADDLMARQPDPFDEVHDHPHIRQDRRVPHRRLVEDHPFQQQLDHRRGFVRQRLVGRSGLLDGLRLRLLAWRSAAATGVELFLSLFPVWPLVAGGTPPVAALPPMVLPAAEGATQVPAISVARVGEKANPAVLAGDGTILQLGMGLQDRIQRDLILPDERFGAIVLVPIGPKRENLFQRYGKKARFSVIIWSVLHTPSSYLIDAKASRGRARFFCAIRGSEKEFGRYERSIAYRRPRRFPLRSQCRLAAPNILKRLLGRKKILLSK